MTGREAARGSRPLRSGDSPPQQGAPAGSDPQGPRGNLSPQQVARGTPTPENDFPPRKTARLATNRDGAGVQGQQASRNDPIRQQAGLPAQKAPKRSLSQQQQITRAAKGEHNLSFCDTQNPQSGPTRQQSSHFARGGGGSRLQGGLAPQSASTQLQAAGSAGHRSCSPLRNLPQRGTHLNPKVAPPRGQGRVRVPLESAPYTKEEKIYPLSNRSHLTERMLRRRLNFFRCHVYMRTEFFLAPKIRASSTQTLLESADTIAKNHNRQVPDSYPEMRIVIQLSYESLNHNYWQLRVVKPGPGIHNISLPRERNPKDHVN